MLPKKIEDLGKDIVKGFKERAGEAVKEGGDIVAKNVGTAAAGAALGPVGAVAAVGIRQALLQME